MGFFMRLGIILFYLIVQSLFFVFLPLIFLIFILLTPLLYLAHLFGKTEEEKKNATKQSFISSHALKDENKEAVNRWFEDYYLHYCSRSFWWKKKSLFSSPPLARDWAVGYTPTLDQYVEELTSSTYQARIKNIVDREKEIAQIETALSKASETNILVVGEEGVGKHTIVDALARKIYEGKTNNTIMYKRILKLNMEKVLSENTDPKKREFFIEELFKEAVDAKNVILLIDDFDRYISSGETRIDLSGPIEKYGKTSKIQIVGITTPFSFQRYVFTNQKINQIFTKVDVYEITKTEAEKILLDNFHIFETRHKVYIPYETIKNVIDKSDYYITHIPFPEKAIELLDAASAYTVQNEKKALVLPEVVDKIIAEKTHVPTTLTEEIKQKLTGLETQLSSSVIDQQEAIVELSGALRRSFLLMGKRKKPLATFLFLGPTGVGKTETAKAVSRAFFGSDKYLIRFDMSLYQSKADIPKLVGSVDSGNPGLMTTAIREKPYGVLLLDEVEKADHDLLNIFLTILDEGYFTDGTGQRVDCKNLVIIGTSNAGADLIYLKGEGMSVPNQSDLINLLIQKHIFTPEFLNRFDGVIIYKPLKKESIVKIARNMLNTISDNVNKLYKVKLQVSDLFLANLIDSHYNEKFGARNIERVIRTEVEDKVAKLILENKVKEGEVINLS
jgi:ATP-dependent Clp protease ATP-binding subunit ClpC